MNEVRLLYKPDAAEAMERMTAWWAGRKTDRVVASVIAPRRGRKRPPLLGTPEQRIIDFETIKANLDAELENTFYGGEAFPSCGIFSTAVPLGIFLGCRPTFREDTTWQAPVYERWEDPPQITADPHNHYWGIVRDLIPRLVQDARGRYLICGWGYGALADVLCNLYGGEVVLMAAITDPQNVRRRLNELLSVSRSLGDQVGPAVSAYQPGSIDWLGAWGPGKTDAFQNDISCMVSPSMYREVFLEEIRREVRLVDHSLYHLDGPGAVKHLDTLLALDGLGGIQWTPGAGVSEDPMDWLDLLRRVQAKGKKLYILTPAASVAPLLRSIDRAGVYLRVGCRDEEEATEVLRTLDRIGT